MDEPYDLNIGRFIADHPDYTVQVGTSGFGYRAQRRGPDGHGTGPRYSALTLDELAEKLHGAQTAES